MSHLYLLERQATTQARDVQTALVQRQRLEQARDASRSARRAIRSAMRCWSLPGLAAAWIRQPGAMST